MPLYDLPDASPKAAPVKKRKRKKKEVVELTAVQELIKRRRLQMVLHSAIYYKLHTSIISDDTWQSWADELTKLQHDNPKLSKCGWYDEIFEDWNGSTGMHLPINPNIQAHAEWMIQMHEKRIDSQQ